MSGREELRHRGERVEERTDAQHDQSDMDDLANSAAGLGKAADRGRGVERPPKCVPRPDPFTDREADRAKRQQARDDHAQKRDAASEAGQRTAGCH